MILASTPENLAAAVDLLRHGGLLVIPTETVYGLAADAMNADAVARIFAAKNRPADNPLIVHGASVEALVGVTSAWPDTAQKLADAFWPGPLTLVLPKAPHVPLVTTGSLDTVAVRVPAHPVALDLLRGLGGTVAAPSANRFMALSPTRAQDVDPTLLGPEGLILDGGACDVGIESTVLSLIGPVPRLLRPGHIKPGQIEVVLGIPVEVGPGEEKARRAPGQYPRHYAPSVPVRLVARLDGQPGIALNPDPVRFAAQLYAQLKQFESHGSTEILLETPPTGPEWDAVWDRLRRMQG